jgi:hypothetical protein
MSQGKLPRHRHELSWSDGVIVHDKIFGSYAAFETTTILVMMVESKPIRTRLTEVNKIFDD